MDAQNMLSNLFGRCGIVPIQEHLSEAGALIVDQRIGFNVVPTVPSFQLSVDGYKTADFWLRKFETEPLAEDVKKNFQFQFEKLVCLDYLIRNTNRRNDNWLIKYNGPKCEESMDNNPPVVRQGTVNVAAIENGLAFPFKHPDQYKSYPYHWEHLLQAQTPFSEEIKDLILPKISDVNFVESLTEQLYELFRKDESFNHDTFEQQMSVMRGQVVSLCHALRENKSPGALVQMPVVVVTKMKEQTLLPRGLRFKQRFHDRKPFFSW